MEGLTYCTAQVRYEECACSETGLYNQLIAAYSSPRALKKASKCIDCAERGQRVLSFRPVPRFHHDTISPPFEFRR